MEYTLISERRPDLTAIEQVLVNRGISENILSQYLRTSDEHLKDCSTIDRIDEGAKMLAKHIINSDDMFIQVDSDCDGYTSSAVLINYINLLMPSYVKSHITFRMHNDKSHGIKSEWVPDGIKIVIIPDAGSNDYEEHKKLRDRGIDVLVIDHHEADTISQDACVINNQLCDYPTKSLSGVGMVYKFCTYLDKQLKKDYADKFLDLVALGLIADMMDLRDLETRHLVTKGIDSIRNPFISAMIDRQDYSISKAGGLNPFSIAFYIAPQVNAITRTGTAEEKRILFLSMLDTYAYTKIPSTKSGARANDQETIVEQAIRYCTNVKNRQTKIQDRSVELIEKIIKEKNLLNNKILLIQLEPEYATDKNLTGLIANKLMAKYCRPVLILNKKINEETKEIAWEGSGRGYEKSKLKDFRTFLKNSNLVYLAEGHANAMGVGITDENIQKFIDYSNKQLADLDFTPQYMVDFIYEGNDCIKGEEILDIYRWKNLWGQNVDEPYICLKNIKLTSNDINLMAKGTLRLDIRKGLTAIKFGSSEEEAESIMPPETGYVILDIIGLCSYNNYSDGPQIKIVDYNIVNLARYYF